MASSCAIGNAKGAKEAAQQAADVAVSIQNLTGGAPQADVSDIEVDELRNSLAGKEARQISTESSRIAVLVVPTNEELAIARDCMRAI